MGEVYQFKCLECDLEFKIGCGVGGSSSDSSTRFFCEECNKICISSFCEQCNRSLKRVIFPLYGNTVEIDDTEDGPKLACPHCSTNNTMLVLLDKWVMNFQIW